MIFYFRKLILSVINKIANTISTIKWKFFLSELGSNSKIYSKVSFMYPNKVSIGNGCLIDKYSKFSSELPSCSLKIGDNVIINRNVLIDFTGGLVIGKDVLISRDTYILTHSHGDNPRSEPIPKELIIEDNVWIGAKVIIGANVNYIGKNSIIGFGSNVTKNVERNTVVGGNPAKILRKLK